MRARVQPLMELLRKARLDSKLLEFFPQQKRSWPEFEEHFNAAGLPQLVDYARKKLYDQHCQVAGVSVGGRMHTLAPPARTRSRTHPPTPTPTHPHPPTLQDLATAVRDMVAADPPAASAAVLAELKVKHEEWGLDNADVVKVGGVVGGWVGGRGGPVGGQVGGWVGGGGGWWVGGGGGWWVGERAPVASITHPATHIHPPARSLRSWGCAARCWITRGRRIRSRSRPRCCAR